MKKRLVVLTGAGVSAESGLRTFRDSDGLWEGHDVGDVATPGAWKRNPQLVLDFYNARRMNVLAAQPNAAHYGFATLEKDYEVTIITQNIDDLHERAGSSNVVHLHGQMLKMRSEKNEARVYDIIRDIKLGDKAEDEAQLRPHIVWFEEEVPMMPAAINIVRKADIFVIAGTSLVVYPAASLIHYAPRNIPAFIIDKRIPYTVSMSNITSIEKPATEGIKDLLNLLSV